MLMRVLIPLYLLLSLTACGTTEIVEKPVPVEIIVTEYVPIPVELTRSEALQEPFAGMTYGDAIEAWARDRSALTTVNARLRAIRELVDENTDTP